MTTIAGYDEPVILIEPNHHTAAEPPATAQALAQASIRAHLAYLKRKGLAFKHAEDACERLAKIAEHHRPTNDEVDEIITVAWTRILSCPQEGHEKAMDLVDELCLQYWGKA